MTKSAKIFLIFGTIVLLLLLAISLQWLIKSKTGRRGDEPLFLATTSSQEISLIPVNIVLELYEGKIMPKEFKVKPKQPVNLTIISNAGEHLFYFVAEGVFDIKVSFKEAGETWFGGFIAPATPGKYYYYCDKEG
ncbi:hypothetical protein H5T58_01735, partial [Candidatus Parcubacteria bacterium]|nr:hypothetical protein [Candidatus Parcubacteria bacterium]